MHGGCLCGTVRFAISPPYRWFSHCHCSMCRKHHGSLFGTGLGVRRESFRWLEGANEIVHYRATAAFERPFCRRCGSTVPAVSQDERYWNVPAGLLDADPGARPRTHIFAASRSPLTELDDEHEHIRATLLLDHLKPGAKGVLELLALVLGAGIALGLAWFAVRLVWLSYTLHDVAPTGDATPLWIPQIAMALGCVGFALAFVQALWSRIAGQPFFARATGDALHAD
jgi:hypothetical protein